MSKSWTDCRNQSHIPLSSKASAIYQYLEIPLACLEMFPMKENMLAVWKKNKSIWSRFQVFISITRTNISLSPRTSCVGDFTFSVMFLDYGICLEKYTWKMIATEKEHLAQIKSWRTSLWLHTDLSHLHTSLSSKHPELLPFQPANKVVSCTFCWYPLCLFLFSLLWVKFLSWFQQG